MDPSLSYEIEQQSFDQDTMPNHNSEGIFPALPPSFSSLLTNCCSTAEQAANQPTVPKEIDLKSQIMVGCINEMSGNGTEAESFLSWGKSISCSLSLPLFAVAFASVLGKCLEYHDKKHEIHKVVWQSISVIVSRLLSAIYLLSATNVHFALPSCIALSESHWASYFHQASLGTHLNYQFFPSTCGRSNAQHFVDFGIGLLLGCICMIN
ncbi:hypothetical protein REPUB_Repub08aG0116600 [Reevesia pubescens]